MSTRKQEFRSIFRAIEMVLIEKRRPLAYLLLVGALFTNKPLDFNSEVNSHFASSTGTSSSAATAGFLFEQSSRIF